MLYEGSFLKLVKIIDPRINLIGTEKVLSQTMLLVILSLETLCTERYDVSLLSFYS